MIASKENNNSLNQNSKNMYNEKNSGNKFEKDKKISSRNKNKTIKKKVKTNATFINNKK